MNPLEVVRRTYEDGWFDEKPKHLFEHVAADAELVNPPEAVEPGTRRGVAEMAEALLNMYGGFDESRHELRLLYGTEDVVVADVKSIVRSRGSSVDVSRDEVHTWTFRDGEIVRFEWGRDLRGALEAVGLSE